MAGAEQPPGSAVEQHLGQPLGAADAERPPARGPRERRLVELDAPFARLGLGEARPCDSGSVYATDGIAQRVEARLVAGAHLRRHLALVGGLVGQHRLARDVADGEDVTDVGALLAVGGDEAAFVDVHAGVPGADPVAVRANVRPRRGTRSNTSSDGPSPFEPSKVTRSPESPARPR